MIALKNINHTFLRFLIGGLLLLLSAQILYSCTFGDSSPLDGRRCGSGGECGVGYQCEDGYCQTVEEADIIQDPDIIRDRVQDSDTAQDTLQEPDTIRDPDTAQDPNVIQDTVQEPDTAQDFDTTQDTAQELDIIQDSDTDQDTVQDFEIPTVCEQTCGVNEVCYDGHCVSAMAIVPEGAFMMGCNTQVDNNCWEDHEDPYHEVNVVEFEIDLTEVTLDQYRRCVEDTGYCSEPAMGWGCNWGGSGRENYPVNCINWYQARAYCEWSGKRLCSESEWEKAARGTDGRIFPWGNEMATCDRAVMFGNEGPGCDTGETFPVGFKPSGVYGLYDMAGNVWEWVEDDWHDNYNGAPTNGEAWLDNPRAFYRVVRGGGFFVYAGGLRTSIRGATDPSTSNNDLGVRCCSY